MSGIQGQIYWNKGGQIVRVRPWEFSDEDYRIGKKY